MPLQFASILAQSLGNYQRLRVPAPDVKDPFDQYRTVCLQDLKSLEPTKQLP
jgi:hypothetical protein